MIAVQYHLFFYLNFQEYLAPKGNPAAPEAESNDLSSEAFWVLAASGPLGNDQQPNRHDVRAPSDDPFQFV